MIQNPKWEFASTGGGQEAGINNPLTEHFEGDYNYYLAREIIQNSIDARDDYDKPVHVKFQIDFFPCKDFPGLDDFNNILMLCKSTHPNDKKTKDFINVAITLLEQEKLPVLKVSDFNTTGLHGGDKDRDKPWYSLVKSTGVSKKTTGEGGSFGIGKGAPYAASSLRTVFYSTTSKIDAKSRFIGVAMLVNFDDNGDTKQSVGTYGLKGQSTIYDARLMGDFRRSEKGLDIFIMGYKFHGSWKDQLIKSILRNFWYAVLNEDLTVEVNGTIISINNLENLLTNYFLDEPFKDFVEPVGNPLYYYRAVMSVTSKEFKKNLETLGNVRFHFLQIANKINYVAMMRRSHMVIYAKMFHYASPYAGVFICDDPKGNEELKKMEPPAHNLWDPNRNEQKGREIIKEIQEWIRSCLNQMKEERKAEVLDVPELERYLPLSEDYDRGSPKDKYDPESQADKQETSIMTSDNMVFKITSIVEPYRISVLNKEESGLGGSGVVIRTGKPRDNRKKHPPAPGVGTGKNRALSEKEFSARVYSVSKNFVEQTYGVLIQGMFEGKCNLYFKAIGEEGDEKIRIKEIIDPRGYNYKVTNNKVHGFYIENNKEAKIKLLLKDKIKCSLKVEAYEIQ